jgi:mannose-6-phosphate isomerase-like protein (cupin superfamily)
MSTVHTRIAEIQRYLTLDGSEIRELMHPDRQGARNQSLAEAILPPGAATRLHLHHVAEEIYHVTAGQGRMTLGEARLDVFAGDTVLIPPGTPHRIQNTGESTLRILCCCSPAYRHEDTELLEISDARQSTNAAALL